MAPHHRHHYETAEGFEDPSTSPPVVFDEATQNLEDSQMSGKIPFRNFEELVRSKSESFLILEKPGSLSLVDVSPTSIRRRVARSSKICPRGFDTLSGFGGSLKTGSIPHFTKRPLGTMSFGFLSSGQREANISTRTQPRRRDVLQDASVVHRIIRDRCVGELQVVLGQMAPMVHSVSEQLLTCLAAAKFDRIRYLLVERADPLLRTSDGSVALHLAGESPETVRLLLNAAPRAASIRNFAGETPLEVHLSQDHLLRMDVLREWRNHQGPGVFFLTGKDGYTLCRQLVHAERKELKLMPGWNVVEEIFAPAQEVKKMVASLRKLHATLGNYTSGLLQYHFIEDLEDQPWQHAPRLQRIWRAAEVLLRTSCEALDGNGGGLTEEDRLQYRAMTGRLLSIVGGRSGPGDVGHPHRAEFAACVAELQQIFHQRIGSARLLLKNAPEPEEREAWAWLHGRLGPPLDKIADGVELPFGNSLRMDLNLFSAAGYEPLQVPSWVNTHDLDAALENLESLKAGLNAEALLSPGPMEPRTFFGWLHCHWLWALCRNASGEVESLMKGVFDQFAAETQYPEILFRAVPESSAQIWESAQKYSQEDVQAMEREAKSLKDRVAKRALEAESKAQRLAKHFENYKDEGFFREMYEPRVIDACNEYRLSTCCSSAILFASQLAAGKYKGFSLRIDGVPSRMRPWSDEFDSEHEKGPMKSEQNLEAPMAVAFDVLRLEDVPSHVTSRDLHKVIQHQQGFLGVWLERCESEPGASRRGFAWFQDEVSAARCCTFLKEMRSKELPKVIVPEKSPTRPVCVVPGEFSNEDFHAHLSRASDIIRELDTVVGVPDSVTQAILGAYEDVEAQLDISILYLRKVHSFCFYSVLHCSSPFELILRSGAAAFMRRNDRRWDRCDYTPISIGLYSGRRSFRSGSRDLQHASDLDAFIRALGPPAKNKLFRSHIEKEWKNLCKFQTMQVGENKFKCRICQRCFFSPDQVASHIANRHNEKRKGLKSSMYDDMMRNAFLEAHNKLSPRSQRKADIEASSELYDPTDPLKLCFQARAAPANFVCGTLGAEVICSSALCLRRFYTGLEQLSWGQHGAEIVRTQNGFHRDSTTQAGSYRDLKVWLVLRTSVGPLVAEVVLHLAEYYKIRCTMDVFLDCVHGSFEPEGEARESWLELLMTLSNLLHAEHKQDYTILEECIGPARAVGCSANRLLQAEKLAHRLRRFQKIQQQDERELEQRSKRSAQHQREHDRQQSTKCLLHASSQGKKAIVRESSSPALIQNSTLLQDSGNSIAALAGKRMETIQKRLDRQMGDDASQSETGDF